MFTSVSVKMSLKLNFDFLMYFGYKISRQRVLYVDIPVRMVEINSALQIIAMAADTS